MQKKLKYSIYQLPNSSTKINLRKKNFLDENCKNVQNNFKNRI